MATPIVQVDGGLELRRRLRNVEDGIADLKTVHKDAAEIVEHRASALVPRRSGALAASLRSAGQQSGGVVRAGRARVPYAGAIHFGSPKQNISPNPFLYDAADQRRTEVIEVFEERVDGLLKKHRLD